MQKRILARRSAPGKKEDAPSRPSRFVPQFVFVGFFVCFSFLFFFDRSLLFVCLGVCLIIFLFVSLRVRLFVCLFVDVFVCLCVCFQ